MFGKIAIAAVLCLVCVFPMSSAAQEAASAARTAQYYIEAFRRGEDFSSPVARLVTDYRVNKATLPVLAKELSTGTPEVREKIVELLVEMALEANEPDPTRFRVIHDSSIIKVLLTEGFAKSDAARSAAARALRLKAKPEDLAKFQDIYMRILAGPQASSVLYLVAKAKILQAKDLVEKMAASGEFKDSRSIKVAQAALGNMAVEDTFIAAAREAEKHAHPGS